MCYCSRHTMFRLRQTTALVDGFGRRTHNASLLITRKFKTCSAFYQEAKVKVFWYFSVFASIVQYSE